MGLEAAAPLNFSQLFCLFRRQEGPSGQASTTPMESVINRHLLQSNFIRVSSQSTKNNKVYSTPSHKMYHQMQCLGCTECRIPNGNITMTVTVAAPW
jgi:hypothetical protein